jgi:hypothetical protein
VGKRNKGQYFDKHAPMYHLFFYKGQDELQDPRKEFGLHRPIDLIQKAYKLAERHLTKLCFSDQTIDEFELVLTSEFRLEAFSEGVLKYRADIWEIQLPYQDELGTILKNKPL